MWSDAVYDVLARAAAAQVVRSVRDEWGGARIYVPLSAVRLAWRDTGRAPTGAAERFAATVTAAVQTAGGSEAEARGILLPLAGRHIVI